MKEILINQDKDILIRDTPDQKQNYDNGLSLITDFCLIDVPVELRLDTSEKAEEKTFKQESQLMAANSGEIEGVSSLTNEISSGYRVSSGVGSFTGNYLLRKDKVIKLTDDMRGEKSCFIGFVANALRQIRKADLGLGHKVAVFGQGLSGALISRVAKNSGADVVAIDVDRDRLNLTEQAGIKSINLTNPDSISEVMKFSDGIGVDIAFISAKIASDNLWKYIWRIVRPEGLMVIAQSQDINLNYNLIAEKNVNISIRTGYKMWKDYFPASNIINPASYVRWDLKRDLDEAKSMICSGRISTDSLISRRVSIKRSSEISTIFPEQKNAQLGILLEFT